MKRHWLSRMQEKRKPQFQDGMETSFFVLVVYEIKSHGRGQLRFQVATKSLKIYKMNLLEITKAKKISEIYPKEAFVIR